MSVIAKGFVFGIIVFGLAALVYYATLLEPPESVVTSASSQYIEVPCWFNEAPDFAARCGRLQVSGRNQAYHLPVVILQAANLNTTNITLKSTPLLYLGGGPGSGIGLGEEEINSWIGWYERQKLTQPLVLMDYRSTGLARPKFSCPPFYRDYVLSLTQPEKLAAGDLFNTSGQCFSIWRMRGFDERDFTSEAFASDYLSLVKIMGYSTVDVYGVSFGTIVALKMALQEPTIINSMVLDSPVNPLKSGPHFWPDRLSNALDGYFGYCQVNENCVLDESEFRNILEQLKQSPNILEVSSWHQLGGLQVNLADQLFISVFFNSLYSPQYLTRFSDLNLQGAFSEPMNGILESYINDAVDPAFNHFVYYANRCMDNSAFDPEIYASGFVASRWKEYIGFQPQYDICALIERPNHPPSIELAKIDTPVTILSGELDPITPLRDAKELAAVLKNSLFIGFSGVGHGVVNGEPCMQGHFSSLLNSRVEISPLLNHCDNASLE